MKRPSWLASRTVLEAALPKDFEPIQDLPARVVAGVVVASSVVVTYHTDGRVTFVQAPATVTPWLSAGQVSARYWVGSEAKRAVTLTGIGTKEERWALTLPTGEQLLEGVGSAAEADEILMRGIGMLNIPESAVPEERMAEVLRLVCDPEDVMELGPGAVVDGVVTFRRPVGWRPIRRPVMAPA